MAGNNERLLWPSLSVALSALFWGTVWIPLRKVAGPGIPAGWSGVLIYAIPALVALPLIAARGRVILGGGWALLLTALGVGVCNALFAVALTLGEVGMIVLLFYLNPIWATLLERMVLGTPIARLRLISVGLGLAGLVALEGLAGRLPFPANAAEWMGLIAGVGWAIALVASNLAHRSSIFDKTTLQFVCSAVVGILLVPAMNIHGDWPSVAGIRGVLPWILATAGCWIVPAMGLSLWGASRMSPSRASMLLMLEVVVGLGTSAWLAGEDLGINKLVGGGLIMSASLADAWGSARSDRKAAALGAAERV